MLNRTDRGHVKNENFNSLFSIFKNRVYTNAQMYSNLACSYGESTRGGGGGGEK